MLQSMSGLFRIFKKYIINLYVKTEHEEKTK